MPSSAMKVLVLLAALVVSPLFAAPEFDEQNQQITTKKKADNPKKPATGKNAANGEKVKTEDRMSTRGLKPPPKDSDKDKDKTAKPDPPPKP